MKLFKKHDSRLLIFDFGGYSYNPEVSYLSSSSNFLGDPSAAAKRGNSLLDCTRIADFF